MSQFYAPPSLESTFKELKNRIQNLENALNSRTFTLATRPASAARGAIIFVSDGGAGSQFQGWNGSGWVSLG